MALIKGILCRQVLWCLLVLLGIIYLKRIVEVVKWGRGLGSY